MDGFALLITHLDGWARRENVRMERHKDLLRLESGGIGRAAVTFPRDFWDEFERLADSEQESVLHAIQLQVSQQFDAKWTAQHVKDIPFGMSLVEGLERRA